MSPKLDQEVRLGRTWMSEEEIRRAGVLKRVKEKELTQVQAAEMLGMSYRQLKRIYLRYREAGPAGLIHASVGKASNRATPPKQRKRVVGLVRKHYSGAPGERFGPTLAAEHLREDHGIAVDAETLRRWMLAEGLWTRERKRKPYRQRRERRGHFGELVQMDGSFEAWLEDRGPRGCLIHMVDDATSTSLATFADEETTWGVADTLRAWVSQYGVPRALYVDWKTVYHHAPTPRQKQEGIVPVSQFGGMCNKLGIELIGANSPQAKACVSYCTSSRLRNGENWLPGASASLALANRVSVQRFVETAPGIVVAVLSQPALSCPKIDCSGRHAMPHAHFPGCE
jgi:transposase